MRSPKRSRDLGPVDVIYGINLNSLQVERVLLDAKGTLTKLEADQSHSIHRTGSGRNIESEVRSFFNLSDLLWLPSGPNLDSRPEVIELGRKAANLRAARELKGK